MRATRFFRPPLFRSPSLLRFTMSTDSSSPDPTPADPSAPKPATPGTPSSPRPASTRPSKRATPPSRGTSALRILAVVVGSALVGVGATWLWHQFRPGSSAEEDAFTDQARPDSEFLNPEKAIAFYEARLRRNPDRVADYVALAQLYLQQGRVTADEPTYVPKAQRAIAEALKRAPDDFHALAVQGSLFNILHEFEKGEASARSLLRTASGNAFPYGVLIDALVELGRYPEAVAVSDSMMALRPSIASYSRVAYLRELHGDTDGAIAAMRLAADASANGREDRAWALYQLAKLYLGTGDTAKARVLYRGILDERPSFARARLGLAHLSIIGGKPAEAIPVIDAVLEDTPLEDGYVLLEEAYGQMGKTAEAKAAADKAYQTLLDAEKMGEVVDMEVADFLADHDMELDEALRRAEIQIRRRPGHLHANETYAWVLHKKGRSAEGIPHIERAMAMNTGDAMVHFRAAEIYAATGQAEKAREQYRLAVEGHVGMESLAAAARARQMMAAR